jgi:pimeloyl-ACP methyl ester carboxylesterase
MEKKTFTHNGLEFTYYQTGSGDLDLFIQHGYSDSALCWGHLPETLGQNYRITLMDARGHGESTKPENGYDLTTMARDMIALMKHLNMKKPVIIGHSMGGSLAAHIAALEPDLPGGAVLIDPAFRNRTVVSDRSTEMEELKKKSVDEIAVSIRSKHPDWPEEFVKPSAEAKLKMSMNVIQLMGTIDTTWKNDLKKATCPMLLITADEENGAIVTKETAEYVRDNHPNMDVLHIPDAGHSIQREKYTETRQAIEEFLKKISGGKNELAE